MAMAHHHHSHSGAAHAHAHAGHVHTGHAQGPTAKLQSEATGRAFTFGIVLNLAFVAIEAAFGFRSHSLALIADASHNFGDVISLVLAGAAMMLAQRSPSAKFTYGFRGSTILAAVANAMLLLVVTGGILWASIGRLRAPAPIAEMTVVVIAGLGVVINVATAMFFASSRHHDLNSRGAFVHMAADAAVSLGVILAALVMRSTGWIWLDPVVSIIIALVIFVATWDLLKQSLGLAVQAVPATIDAALVREFLTAQEGVQQAHDLHIWAISTTETAMTAHLVMPAGHPGDAFLDRLAAELDQRFRVTHVTLQVEIGANGRICAMACEAALENA